MKLEHEHSSKESTHSGGDDRDEGGSTREGTGSANACVVRGRWRGPAGVGRTWNRSSGRSNRRLGSDCRSSSLGVGRSICQDIVNQVDNTVADGNVSSSDPRGRRAAGDVGSRRVGREGEADQVARHPVLPQRTDHTFEHRCCQRGQDAGRYPITGHSCAGLHRPN